MLATLPTAEGNILIFCMRMFRIIKLSVLLAILLIATTLSAQNVTGHWYGIGMLQTTEQYNGYLSEMILRQKGKIVWGELHYYFKDSLVKVALNGNFDEQTHKLNIKPFKVMYYLSPTARNSIDCRLSGNFVLLASKTESVLTGSLVSDADHRYTVPNINLRLLRSNDTASIVLKDTPEAMRKDTVTHTVVSDSQPLETFTKRPKSYTKELDIVNATLRLEIYDNGRIDYDSVSLYLNNKMILPKTMLTHKAIRLTVQLDPNLEFNELSMFAENLGMIPPNTAALIVYDGKTRYEIMLTSDLSKSATLKLKRKK